MDALQNLKVTINNDNTALIEFNRPDKRNAFSQAMIGEMVMALDQLDKDASVRAVVLCGSPAGPFCGTHHYPGHQPSRLFFSSFFFLFFSGRQGFFLTLM